MKLEISGLRFSYSDREVLDHLDFQVAVFWELPDAENQRF